MKHTISIIEFLRTGRFGGVEINDSIATVIRKLGQPDGELNHYVIKPRTGLHYGMYEFTFVNDRLESIQNDHFDPCYPELMEFENKCVIIHSELLKADRKKQMREVITELNDLAIGFRLIDYWGRKAIRTVANVVIDFNDEPWSDEDNNWNKIVDVEDAELIGIRYSP